MNSLGITSEHLHSLSHGEAELLTLSLDGGLTWQPLVPPSQQGPLLLTSTIMMASGFTSTRFYSLTLQPIRTISGGRGENTGDESES